MSKVPTYAQTGVDYSAMDPVKVLAQKAAASTAPNLSSFGASEVGASRGESAYVWEEADAELQEKGWETYIQEKKHD